MRVSLLIIFLSLLFPSLKAQTGNDCYDAVVISSLPYHSPTSPRYSTCNVFNDYSEYCNNIYASGKDFVFELTPTTDITINAKLETFLGIRFGLFIVDGNPNLGANCIAQGVNTSQKTSNSRSVELKNVHLKANVTYYLIYDEDYSNYNCNDFELTVDQISGYPTPKGSNCRTANRINTVPYTNLGVTNCGIDDYVNEGNIVAGRLDENLHSSKDYLFVFSPEQDQCIALEAKSKARSGFMSIFQGCPYDNTSEGIQKAIMKNGVIRDQISLVGGETYFIVLSSDKDLDTCAAFELRIREGDTKGANCSDPVIIGSLPYVGNNMLTTCKNDDFYGSATCTPTNYTGEDMVFTYNSPGNECLSVELTNLIDSSKMSLALGTGCPNLSTSQCLALEESEPYISTNVLGLDYQINNPQQVYIAVDYAIEEYSPFLLYNIEVNRTPADGEGKDCQMPLVATTVPFNKKITTACKGRDYPGFNHCSAKASDELKGNDHITKFTAPTSECIRISVRNVQGTGAVSLLSACPTTGSTCLAQLFCNQFTDSASVEYTVTAGTTYYLVTTSFTDTKNLSFDLAISSLSSTDPCEKCRDITCTNCANAGFEEMSGTKWSAMSGEYADPNQYNLPITTGVNALRESAALHSAGSFDPIVGPELKTVSPYGGDYSLRLGDPYVSGELGGMSQTVTYRYKVDAANSNFYYYYAVVFEDPAHDLTDQPYFKVEMYDQNNQAIPCGFYEVSAAGDIPGFKVADRDFQIKWKNWTLVGVPLEGYIGQEVRIEFIVKDCRLGGHFGYAYIDADCKQPSAVLNSQVLCGKNDSIIVEGPEDFASYRWSTGDTTQTIQVRDTGNIVLDVVNYSGCSIRFNFRVNRTLDPEPTTQAITKCESNILTVQAQRPPGNYTSYGWDFGNGVMRGDTMFQTFPISGSYTATYVVQTGGCTFEYPHDITILSNSLRTKPVDTTCAPQTYSFELNFNDSLADLTWFDGNKNKERVFSNPGVYPFTVSKDGCTLLDTARFAWVVAPAMTLGPDRGACEDQSIQLAPTGGPYKSYLWNTGDETPFIYLNSSGTFKVSVDYGYCILEDSVQLTFDTIPYFEFPADTTVCGSIAFQLNTGYPNAVWQDNSVRQSFPVTSHGKYFATVTNGSCQRSDTTIVDVTPSFTLQPIADSILCEGDLYNVDVVDNATNPVYLWADGYPGSDRSIYYAGNYALQVTQGACKEEAIFKVGYVPRPTPDLGVDFDTCETAVFDLDPGFYDTASYLWNTGAITQKITVSQAGTYSVVIRKASCVTTADVNITTTPPPFLSIGLDTTICLDFDTPLDATTPGGTVYQWSTGESTPIITVNKGGIYSVVVTSPPCQVFDTITLRELPSPIPVLKDTLLCPDDSVVLHAFQPNCTYLWENGSTRDSIYARSAHAYTVLITNQYDCYITDTSEVALALTCPELYVPNVFTPDGDGYNDYFFPVMFEVEVRELLIFNRFGEIIFESNSQNAKWDGTYKGKEAKEDVYPWKFTYYTYDGQTHIEFGHVTLLR